MMADRLTRSLAALTLMGVALASRNAVAQEGENARGWSFFPSAQIGAVYNDNLYFRRSDAGESAVYGRYGGTLDLVHNGAGSSFRGGYAFTGELFSGELEDLSEFPASQRASVGVTSRLGSQNSVNASASYRVSQDPREVFDPVGVEFGRRRAESYSASAGYGRRLSATHSLQAQYNVGFRELGARSADPELELGSISHSVSVAWNQNFSSRTTGALQYLFSFYRNDSRSRFLGFSEPFKSHAAVYGWRRVLSPRWIANLEFGPSFYESVFADPDGPNDSPFGKKWTVTPRVHASMAYKRQSTSFSVSYSRQQNQFLGASGQVITDSLSLSLEHRPSRILSLEFSTGAQRNSQAAETFETYRAGASFGLELARWWSLNGSYSYAYQERFFGFLGEDVDLTPGGRTRNHAYLGMVIGKTIPLE